MTRILLAITSALATLILVPAVAAADPGVTDISGVVSYNGNPVGSGITVTVNCKGNILTDTTDSSGSYFVEYSQTKCQKNQTATASATVNGHTGSNSGETKDGGSNKLNVAVVNINVVPEFGLITAGASALIGGAAFTVIRRRQISGHQG